MLDRFKLASNYHLLAFDSTRHPVVSVLVMLISWRVLQGACCRRKERKAASDEETSEMDADPSLSEEEVPGSLNITDEMKRMLNQL